MSAKRKLYSYIRKPFSKNGWPGLAAAVLGFVTEQAVLAAAVAAGGEISMAVAAAGICSLLFAVAVLPFAVAGMLEKDSNHAFVIAALAVALITIAEWAAVLCLRT